MRRIEAVQFDPIEKLAIMEALERLPIGLDTPKLRVLHNRCRSRGVYAFTAAWLLDALDELAQIRERRGFGAEGVTDLLTSAVGIAA